MNAPIGRDAMIEAQARDWLLRLGAGDVDEGALDAWRAADERHEQAWREAQLAWTAIGRTSFARDDSWRRAARPRPLARRWAGPAAIAASLVVAVAIAPQVAGARGEVVRTDIAQTRTVTLDDGSKVFVGARSVVNVKVDEASRTVVLKDGEAFFEIAHDDARPFTVVAGDAVIRVTGTKFNVCRTPHGVQVSVLEGRVEVLKKRFLSTPDAPDRVITAGKQVRLERGEGLTSAEPVNVQPGAWRSGRLQYADAPLKDVIADANRYSARPIRLASGEIGDLRVTVSFRTRAVDELIAKLDAGLPLSAAREADGDILLRADGAG